MEGSGRVLQVNVSAGGVPKLPVERAWVGRFGLDGDEHNDRTEHGGPHRAVCLFGIEAIERLRAEGHPVQPGSVGENLTTAGVEWSLLPVGARVRVGAGLELELASPAGPCATQTGNFTDGNFNRMRIDRHPSDSRMYARVLHEGEIRPGDPITVLPALPDSRAADELLLKRLDRAEARSSVAAWHAAHEAGFEIHVVEDGELALSCSPEIPGPAFNQAHGFARLPNLLSLATGFFDEHRERGWIWTAEPPWPDAQADLTMGVFGAAPDDIADAHPPTGALIRRIMPDETERFESVGSGAATAGGVSLGTANPWPRVTAQLAKDRARHMFICELDGRPVGKASLHVTAKTGWLRAAAVAPEARGRGIQRALIAARARAAAELGCDLVGASAEPAHVSALNLERTGMRRVGTRFVYIYDPA